MLTISREYSQEQYCSWCEIVSMYETFHDQSGEKQTVFYCLGRCLQKGRRPSMAVIVFSEPSLEGWKFFANSERFCSALGDKRWQSRCDSFRQKN